ncbi:unnamed protein product [Durusdinium trenchii]|uniref:Uncharacterized protein n=2 Tax=Durusdinium trenchii TaxID=1381693 RepID=A0ABP0NWW7_9DINO
MAGKVYAEESVVGPVDNLATEGTVADESGLRVRAAPSHTSGPSPPLTPSTFPRPSVEKGNRVLKHLTTKIAKREVLGYSQLKLQESAYDNAYLLPLISSRFFGRSFFLLVVNFILQYCIAFLLYRRTTLTNQLLTEKLFGLTGPGAGRAGVCWYPEQHNRKVIMCTPDEVFFAADFTRLDLTSDGIWTFEEALVLDNAHARSNNRRVNMTQVYKNLIYQIRSYAGPRVVGCDILDEIEAFDQNLGFWKTAWIWNVTSSENVVVTYSNPPTSASKAYIHKRYTRKKLGDIIYACSIPKCVDMDNGATDRTEATCAEYNGYDACGGSWDDEDFNVTELCCTCGGGSRSQQLTGFGHLPVSLPLEDVSNLQAFRLCMQKANLPLQQDQCIINFTAIPRDIYVSQVQPYTKYCYLPDIDTCSNLKADNALPEFNINISSSVPLFFKMASITTTTDLLPENICRKAVSLFCPELMTLQTSLFLEERTEVCGKKTRQIQDDSVIVSYEASRVYEDQSFGLTSPIFQGFLFLIVFLWGLASVAEFRSILVWWNVLLAQPSCSVEECLHEKWEDDEVMSLDIMGIPRKFRVLSILLNLLPRSILQCLIFFVGIQYLLSVRNISDLILNSLALTFLVTVDEMLFAAFAGEQNAAWVQETKPVPGRSFKCVDWVLAATHIPLGMFMFFPILIWLSYYLVQNKLETDELADATYCLCDLRGRACFAPSAL